MWQRKGGYIARKLSNTGWNDESWDEISGVDVAKVCTEEQNGTLWTCLL